MKAPLSSLLAQDSVPAVITLVIAWQSGARHSGLASRKQKLTSLMQRIQKLEKWAFQEQALREGLSPNYTGWPSAAERGHTRVQAAI